MSSKKKKKKKRDHVSLVLRVTATDARLLAIERVSSPPPDGELRHPGIDDDDWYDLPPDTGELILGFHDADGRLREAFAWPLEARVFREEERGAEEAGDGRRLGSRLDPQVDDRVLWVSIPRRSVFLVVYRTRTRSGDEPMRGHAIDRTTVLCDGPKGERAWDLDVLSAYALNPPAEPPPNLPVEPFEWPLCLPELRFVVQELRRLPSPFNDPPRMRQGWVDSEETYFDHGKPGVSFNLVVMGDGFDRSELAIFDREAKAVIHGVFGGGGQPGVAPFAELRPFVNVHIVRAVSHQSGIGNGEGPPRSTYYETIAGCGTDDAHQCGTDAPELIWQAGRTFAEPSEVGLFLVLVNGAVPGGSAWVDRRTLYLSTAGDPRNVIRIAARAMTWVGLASRLPS